jgi:glycogen operon protein
MRLHPSLLFVACASFAACAPLDSVDPSAVSADTQVAARLGATWGRDSLRFRVRADAATALEVDLYAAPRLAGEVARIPMTRTAPDAPWEAEVTASSLAAFIGPTKVVYYGYRAWGPNWPRDPAWTIGSTVGFIADVDAQGNRYNPNKLLVDPYARELSHDPLQSDAPSVSPYLSGPASRAIDSGPLAPKSVVWAPRAADPEPPAPTRSLRDDVIYEVHVRGLTMSDPTVPEALRGTYAGAATKADALAALGVTAVELLPIHESQNDTNDGARENASYWGYSTLSFFAPDRRYASDKSPGGPTRELRAMVDAFHQRGIKLILDVVYNHTAEGGVSRSNADIAKLYSLRGLDNAAYYELAADHRLPVDNTGTGENINATNPAVRDLVLDSLRYWHEELGVDGFRFDLAPVLGNSCDSGCFSFDANDPAGILRRAVSELPARAAGGGQGVDLIAEPWALGRGTYQLGHFPPGWSEWNGTFRDVVRAAQNEPGTTTPATVAAKISGSPDLFDHDARAPSASINYLDCHDGFTLLDVYSYDAPRNDQPFPLGPSSGGSTTNHSWDQGGGAAAQLQALRTGIALVALSSGVPMIQGGDEMGRTQYGNNNAYNLDDAAMWLDWSLATAHADLVAWTSGLFAFRHAHPALRRAAFGDGKDHNGDGVPDLAWLDASGAPASDAFMHDKRNAFLAWRIDGSEARDDARSIFVAWNGAATAVDATVPPARSPASWRVVADSAAGTLASPNREPAFGTGPARLAPRSVLVLIER